MSVTMVNASYYQQFDADYSLEVPAEGYGGWKQTSIPLSLEHTAVVSMHAWDCGTPEQYPGWYRAADEIPRCDRICHSVFPGLLAGVRRSPVKLFHVVGGGNYYKQLPGYTAALGLAEPSPQPPQAVPDPVYDQLRRFRAENVWVGKHNQKDYLVGGERRDFAPQARPLEGEGIAENGEQLYALCAADGINHLVYVGFCLDWCLLLSPGGMADMQRRGFICSTIRQAVTAVENKETARGELGKELGLWRVALEFGFVFDVDDFITGLEQSREDPGETRAVASPSQA